MDNQDAREKLRGAEERIFDLVMEGCTAEQWAEWLRAPLGRAAAEGDLGLAHNLIEAGAKVGSAVHVAISGGDEQLVSNLLESGASTNIKTKKGNAPIHVAAILGHDKITSLLLQKGADKNVQNTTGYSPLHMAAERGHLEVARVLLDAGADATLRHGRDKLSALDLAAGYGGHVDVLRTMIEHGVDVDDADDAGSTALHEAAWWNKAGTAHTLVKAGANVEARDDRYRTPLHLAASRRNTEVVAALLKHGAGVNALTSEGMSPLHMAVAVASAKGRRGGGAAKTVDLLLRWGADHTAVTNKGESAAQLVGASIGCGDDDEDDSMRVHKLLTNARADRAWRRRSLMVLCRALPDRVQLGCESGISGEVRAGARRRPRNRASLALGVEVTSAGNGDRNGCSGSDETTAGGGSAATAAAETAAAVDERTGFSLSGVVASLLQLEEEGVFRTIVGFL